MTATNTTRLAIITVVLLAVGAVAVSGAATAQTADGDGFDVEVDFPDEFVADNDQEIGINVTNNENTELVSPLIEVVNRSEFDINDSDTATVTVINNTDGTTETRNAEITDSSFRSGNALEIEGVGIPAGETYSYRVGIDVASAGNTDVQFDVRPLNNPSNNERNTVTEEALGFGDIKVNFDNSNSNTVTISGQNTDISTSDSVTEEVIADRSYTVGAEISILDDNLEIPGVTPELSNTQPVWFNETSSATEPTVVGHTQSTANILRPSTRTVRGNATTPTNVTTSYTLDTSGGSTYLVIEDQTTLTTWSETVAFDTDSGTISEIDQTDGVTLVNVTASDDVDGSFDFVGYRVGDIDQSGDVTASDAEDIAQAAADSDLDSINDYGDVTNSDDISVVDAMYIQQYLDGNRDADYDLTGGS